MASEGHISSLEDDLKSIESQRLEVEKRLLKAKEELALLEARTNLIELCSIVSKLKSVQCYQVYTFEKNRPYPSQGSYECGCYTDEKEANRIAQVYNARIKVKYMSLAELSDCLRRNELNSNPFCDDSGY